MHYLQNGSQVEVRPPKKPTAGNPGYFSEQGVGGQPSWPGEEWFNNTIDEFMSVLRASNVTFDPNSNSNLAKAISFSGTSSFDYVSSVDGNVYEGQLISVEDYGPGHLSGRLYFKVVAAGTGVHDGGKFIDLPSSELQLQQNLSKPYNIKAWGAKGNGSDDTAAINAAFNSGLTPMMLPNDVYGITSTITVTSSSVYIYGTHASIIKPLASMSTMLSLEAKSQSVIGIGFDGDQKSPIAINITNDEFSVCNNHIQNLYGTTGGCLGVSVSALGRGSIKNNLIHDLDAVTDSSLGNAVGAVRAISIFATVAARTGRVDVSDNHISTIMGEEGDAIQVAVTSAVPFGDGFVDIYNNTISKCTRRGIKIQASSCTVHGNTYTHDLSESESPVFAAPVEVIGCENVSVFNNTLDGISGYGVSVIGSGYKVKGIFVANNKLFSGYNRLNQEGWTKGTQIACRFEDTSGASAIFNEVTGGVAGFEWVSSSDFTCFGNRDVELAQSAEFFVLVQSSCSNYRIGSNTGFSLDFVREKFIYCAGPSPMIYDNHARYNKDIAYNCVQIASTAYGPYIYNCTSECNLAPTLSSSPTFQYPNFASIANLGSGGSGWHRITFGAEAPKVLSWDRGDIVYNTKPAVGQPIGWQCTSSGSPGTWVVMGNL
ncbi:hypothetical protein NB537_21080 [Vibrio parahaemolyticus]|nr:hypothetical protein [Vibrio parahaemolyticus]MCR9657258.1 hypothetical protein [Vibrio parahaemolyticus]